MESCACSCDYDIAEQYWTKMVKARKQHICCECGEEIEPGEQYEKISMVHEGEFSSHKTCLLCHRIAQDLCCGCYAVEQLRDTIWEALDFDYVTGESFHDKQ